MACSTGHCECKYIRLKCAMCTHVYLLDAYDLMQFASAIASDKEMLKLVYAWVMSGVACHECALKKLDATLAVKASAA